MTTRRNVLKEPAAIAAASIPAAGITSIEGNDARLIELECQRDATITAWRAEPRGLTDVESDKYGDRVHILDTQIDETPAHGLDGLWVKWRQVQYWNFIGSGSGLDEACESFDIALRKVVGGVP